MSPVHAELVRSFLAGAAREVVPDEAESLGTRLARMVEQAREAWPGVRLEPGDFARCLGEHLERTGTLEEALGAVSAEDLWLAHGCLQGDRAALEFLQRSVFAPVERAVRRVDAAPSFVDEVMQLTRMKLLVGTERQGPRLEGYAGRGPLRRWTEAVAVGVAVSLKRGAVPMAPLDDTFLESHLGTEDPELALMRQRYRPAFRASFAEALSRLEARDRNLLRMSLVQGLGVESLGTLHQVHASTVSRWLARARQSLLEGTRDGLARRLALTTSQLDSLLRVLDASLELSLASLLRDGKDPA